MKSGGHLLKVPGTWIWRKRNLFQPIYYRILRVSAAQVARGELLLILRSLVSLFPHFPFVSGLTIRRRIKFSLTGSGERSTIDMTLDDTVGTPMLYCRTVLIA